MSRTDSMKRRTSVTIPAELVEDYDALGLSVQAIFEPALRQAIEVARDQRVREARAFLEANGFTVKGPDGGGR